MGYNFQGGKLKDSFNQKLKNFVGSLGPAISDGKKIPFADSDLSYALELQHNRFKEKGLNIKYELYDRDKRTDASVGAEWRDARYESFVCHEQYGVKKKITKNGVVLFDDNRHNVMYTTITDVISGIHPDNESISCPNCGNVSTLAQLQGGCPYCGTVYKMDDLFPKVTGYHFLEDVAPTSGEHKAKMWLFILGGIVTTLLLGVFGTVLSLIRGDFNYSIIPTFIFILPIYGMGTGFMAYGIYRLVRLFVVGPRQSHGKFGTIGSRNSFEQRMKTISPDFSFEYFTSKAISLIKTAVFAPNEHNLMFYKGPDLDPYFKNIIEMNYGSALGLTGFQEDYGKVFVTTNAFFDVLYTEGDKVIFKRDVFKAVFVRRMDIPMDMNFSMTKMQCPSCGGNFNAVQNKYCPYCGKEYNIESLDWVLVELSRKQPSANAPAPNNKQA
ncbi:MAG: hypothetical protein J6U23_01535 [Clostridiales bacterium]|nr:hypothetical protein [Clostridiales bacterium]